MPETFIGQLNEKLTKEREKLKSSLNQGGERIDSELRAAALSHWHTPLPPGLNGEKRKAFAIDGSRRRANLTNGSTVLVAQALIMGEDKNEPITDIEILPGSVDAGTLDRFADLMLRRLEINLASEYASVIPEGSILYLDGAIYGMLPQLIRFEEKISLKTAITRPFCYKTIGTFLVAANLGTSSSLRYPKPTARACFLNLSKNNYSAQIFWK